MDDLELEARLRTQLHRRFDAKPVPPELAENVRQAMTTAPHRIGFGVRTRGLPVGWPALAAAAIVVVAMIVAGNIGGPLPPGSRPSQTPVATTPAPSVGAERTFIVLPPGTLPDKITSELAVNVLDARLKALGIQNFTSAVGNAILFQIPADGPSDDIVRTVLSATGSVEFVPLPPGDYASLEPVVGEPLPIDENVLFGWEGIESVVMDDSQASPAITITLKPAAKAAFADYTASHPQETLAILIDGRVALLPLINEPIPGGQVTISGGGSDNPFRPDEAFPRMAAIMVGGMLPEVWRPARVPVIVSRVLAINVAKGQFPYGTVESADLTAEPADKPGADGWRAVWIVVVTGVVSAVIPCVTSGPGQTCFVPGPTRRVVIDAERGDVIRIEMPPE